jgi:hypothetical protein
MMDCKSMTTPMTTNLKKLVASNSNLVDPTTYKQMIGSLMYMVNTKSDIYFVVNTLSQFMVESRHVDHLFQTRGSTPCAMKICT